MIFQPLSHGSTEKKCQGFQATHTNSRKQKRGSHQRGCQKGRPRVQTGRGERERERRKEEEEEDGGWCFSKPHVLKPPVGFFPVWPRPRCPCQDVKHTSVHGTNRAWDQTPDLLHCTYCSTAEQSPTMVNPRTGIVQ